jgi:hypothetical protein
VLPQIIDDHYNRIKAVAAADNVKWGGGDINRGYTQLTTEYIPTRSKQLLQTYAPGGTRPLLPGPQDVSAVRLALGRSDTSSPAQQQFVEVSIPVGQRVSSGLAHNNAHAPAHEKAQQGCVGAWGAACCHGCIADQIIEYAVQLRPGPA